MTPKTPQKVTKSKHKPRSAKSKPEHLPLAWIAGALKFWLPRLLVISLIGLLGFTVYLDISIRKKFEGQKWALPAHVYTRPLELYVGQRVQSFLIEDELHELGYQSRQQPDRVGSYHRGATGFEIFQREFRFWDGLREQQKTRLLMADGRIQRINVTRQDGSVGDTEIVRLEPRLFGSVSPMSHEDRSLLALEDTPQDLINAVIAIEDQKFYSHFGINPVGIARAMWRNIQAGRVVQGGSTLTQQLVKNYYLSAEQSYKRKLIEAIMAVLLEMHYGKEEILEAYINEVHLSQDGNRAIHGFELASRYFYGRPLQELELDQLALLAGINNGPSYYNPMRHPERALARRNLVLKTMQQEGHIDDQQYSDAAAKALRISPTAQSAAPLSYPAFLGLVRENLQADYQQQHLASDGLRIYTTLNPRIQMTLQTAAQNELAAIEKRKGIASGSLQVAAAVIRTDNGEVAAMVGDRNPGFAGFNRALNARRPVGSLLKPFVYLTALESPAQYSLASRIADQEIVVSQRGAPDWRPQNYDDQEHGQVMLIDALSKSYNLATVRLGMEIGVERVADTVRRVGYHDKFSELPSILLGAVPMSVLDVGQLYLTLASGGFKTPIKGVRSVLTNQHEPLGRYALTVDQAVLPEFNSLISYALQDVIRNGTGRVVLNGFRYDYGLAGKTGTTDDFRDSWFAGFSGNYLTVVWVGRDDNKPTGLTGASGAAHIWSKAMQQMPLQRLELSFPQDIVAMKVVYSLDPELADCSLDRQLPLLQSSLPLGQLPCGEQMQYDLVDEDESRHFEPRNAPEQPQELESKQVNKRKSFWQRIFGN